jgi:myo-inositol-1(or 4)-monophosphatase
MDITHLLHLAEEAATAAGRLLAATVGPSAVLSNVGRDIKLGADRQAESCILRTLAVSGMPVLTEESGEHGDVNGDVPFWVVDPLDGTFNFHRGIGLCCVSIAVWQGGHPLLGVVHDFVNEERFSGGIGLGARLNGTPVRVSGCVDATTAVLATGLPVHRDYSDASLESFARTMRRFKKVRMLGTAALSAAYVACGRLDAYTESDIMLWDVAAGAALVAAAGGDVDVQWSPRRKWATVTRLAASAKLWEE